MRFKGKITKGIGRHSELIVPGRTAIESPSDWPDRLQPGSLNVRVDPDGFPATFDAMLNRRSVKNLDDGCLPPVFLILQADFGNNMLRATPEMPRRGVGQLWRAVLQTDSHVIHCWVLRRIGSGLCDQLELVSHEHIRSTYGLTDGQVVAVTLSGAEPNQSLS